MPSSRRAPPDPRVLLARLVDRLGGRLAFVTEAELEAAAARPSSRLPADQLPVLIEAAVEESLLLKDLRTFYERESGAYTQAWVYRVNARHPLIADLLADVE